MSSTVSDSAEVVQFYRNLTMLEYLEDTYGEDAPGCAAEDVQGTQAGFRWHRKHGEKPCEPCRLAHNEYECERRRRLRLSA